MKTLKHHHSFIDMNMFVLNFLSQVIFLFLLSLDMVIYANEVETKEKENYLRLKKVATTSDYRLTFVTNELI